MWSHARFHASYPFDVHGEATPNLENCGTEQILRGLDEFSPAWKTPAPTISAIIQAYHPVSSTSQKGSSSILE